MSFVSGLNRVHALSDTVLSYFTTRSEHNLVCLPIAFPCRRHTPQSQGAVEPLIFSQGHRGLTCGQDPAAEAVPRAVRSKSLKAPAETKTTQRRPPAGRVFSLGASHRLKTAPEVKNTRATIFKHKLHRALKREISRSRMASLKNLQSASTRSGMSNRRPSIRSDSIEEEEEDAADTDTGAGERVANAAELLSNILERLDTKTLINTRRVARIFEAHYQAGSILRANTFRDTANVGFAGEGQQGHGVAVNPFFIIDMWGTASPMMQKILPGVNMQYHQNTGSNPDRLAVMINKACIPAIKSHLHQSWTEFHICRYSSARPILVDLGYRIFQNGVRSSVKIYITLKPCTAGTLFEIVCALWKSLEENGAGPGTRTADRNAIMSNREEILVQLKAGGVREDALEAVVGPMYSTTLLDLGEKPGDTTIGKKNRCSRMGLPS